MFRYKKENDLIEKCWADFYKAYVVDQDLHHFTCYLFYSSSKTIYILNKVRKRVIYVPFKFGVLDIKIKGK